MRCKFCGSTSLHPDTQRANFSAGKAALGVVSIGVVGAAAGFIGKDVPGYRCGACGSFMKEPMDTITASRVDSAIKDAEIGLDRTLYDFYRSQYPNIQAVIPVTSASSANQVVLKEIRQTERRTALQAENKAVNVKREYRNLQWSPDCPVYIERVSIIGENNSDSLSMLIFNQSTRPLRSLYIKATVFDDTGDQVGECQCVYQGLEIAPGKAFPAEKSFPLNTTLAYRVELACEKAAFTSDEVWRASEDNRTYVLPMQTEITADNFPRLKYVETKYIASKTPDETLYAPILCEDFWLCDCGQPVEGRKQCPRCKDEAKNVESEFSQKVLIDRQQQIVKARAEKRASKTSSAFKRVESADKDIRYSEAQKLEKQNTVKSLEQAILLYQRLKGWKDSESRVEICQSTLEDVKIQEAKKAEEQKKRAEEERKAAAQREKEAKELAEKKKKIRIIAVTSVASLVVISVAAFLLITKVIMPNNQYKQAEMLMASGKYDEAIERFSSLNSYKDSEDKIIECKYQNAESLLAQGYYTTAATEFRRLGTYKDSPTRELEVYYKYAEDLFASGDYGESIFYYRMANGYKDSDDRLKLCEAEKQAKEYSDAEALLAEGQYDQAYSAFRALGDYKDCSDRMIEAMYGKAVDLIEAGKYDTAYSIFREKELVNNKTINSKRYDAAIACIDAGKYQSAYYYLLNLNYENSNDIFSEITPMYYKETLSDAYIREVIKFGWMEQNYNTEDGKEPIEWIVLSKDDSGGKNRLLVISKYVLDSRIFHSEKRSTKIAEITWENCELRTWLNNSFLRNTFTDAEQAMIPTVSVPADVHPDHKTSYQGNATNDKIFLLSVSEAQKYFSNNSSRQCVPITSALKNGCWVYSKTHDDGYGKTYWWLRTVFNDGTYHNAARIDFYGNIDDGWTTFDGGIRPVMWIDLN